MEKSEQKKLVSKIIEAANTISENRRGEAKFVIYRGKEFIPSGIIYPGARKKVMCVKEWLEEKRKNQHSYILMLRKN